MRETQVKLFEFMRDCEREGRTFTVDEAAERSGLTDVSVRTYISKKLKGGWVDPTDGRHFKVHGLLKLTPAQFEHAMSQKSATAFSDVGEWRGLLHELLDLGAQHGFPVRETLDELRQKLGTGEGPVPK